MDDYYENDAFDIVNQAISQAIEQLGLENRFKLVRSCVSNSRLNMMTIYI